MEVSWTRLTENAVDDTVVTNTIHGHVFETEFWCIVCTLIHLRAFAHILGMSQYTQESIESLLFAVLQDDPQLLLPPPAEQQQVSPFIDHWVPTSLPLSSHPLITEFHARIDKSNESQFSTYSRAHRVVERVKAYLAHAPQDLESVQLCMLKRFAFFASFPLTASSALDYYNRIDNKDARTLMCICVHHARKELRDEMNLSPQTEQEAWSWCENLHAAMTCRELRRIVQAE